MPAIRTLTPATNGLLARNWTDPLNGTLVNATLAAITLVPLAILYGATPLLCDSSTSYLQEGSWIRTWRAVGISVVTTGDGLGMTGKVFTT